MPIPMEPKTQTIAFEGGGGLFERRLDQGDYTKRASGYSGTGAITYSSSDARVATVDPASGAVTLVGAGQATITARIAADAVYLAAENAYLLDVPRPDGIPFDALVGEGGTQVTFPSWIRGHDFLRSSQADCDVAQIRMCVDNQVDTLTTSHYEVTDTAATSSRSAMWWLQRPGTPAAPLLLSHQKFYPRSGPALAGFRGKLWLVGGHASYDYLNADVWNSQDGVFWQLVTFTADFPARSRGRLLAFNDRLWLIGGNGAKPDQPAEPLADVWSSADGVTWREETSGAPFGGRFDHGAVVFNDRMWVIGGTTDGGARSNDVWSSTNGVDWTESNHAAAFSARTGHTVSVMNGRLWLVAGDDGALRDDVWSSDDGIAWTRATAAAGFAPRARHVASAVGGKLCVTGGVVTTPTIVRDLWCTEDGTSWSATYSIGFNQRYDVGSAQLGNRWYFVGGEVKPGLALPQGGVEYFYTDDVHSWDPDRGGYWRRHTPYAPYFSGAPNVLALNDRLFMIGSHDGVRAEEFTHVSDDGTHWAPPSNAVGGQPWGRIGGAFVVHGGRLWVLGGGTAIDDPVFDVLTHDDVWSSSDGASWDAVGIHQFGARYGHAAVSFKGKLFVIGGSDGLFALNDVRSSIDGITWERVTDAAAFAPRFGHQVVVFNGRLWLYGGTNGTTRFEDAWSSEDGLTWQRESTFVPYVDRLGFSMVVHDNRVWMMGGRYYEPTFRAYTYQSEIYVSSDGVHFSRVDYQGRIFSARANAAFVSARGKLWVLGGQDRFSQRNDVWSSTDGIHWSVHVSGMMPYPMPP